ncbi:MAG: hypothetical protein GY799_00515 [Desulfobulbaceae bacterium]|nr:hypothetical protein [Desulfobulbaceae bacterium]
MVIKIHQTEIAENIASEVDLLDQSAMESIYAIRKLRAGILLDGYEIDVEDPNSHGQVFIKEYEIWINKGEYSII